MTITATREPQELCDMAQWLSEQAHLTKDNQRSYADKLKLASDMLQECNRKIESLNGFIERYRDLVGDVRGIIGALCEEREAQAEVINELHKLIQPRTIQ